ncbi:DUF2093 domain-containing protein [Brevundimonas aveniformis]|uniref:DUF2093 domain-containing protein n=1 Tax=Brevundimonas aveniformis TaxID=370977 RepID=UPI00048BEEAF|nr:DUF2093 domain-containing protein [Brevundimonas aveniformis]
MTSQDKSSAQEAQLHYGQGEFVVLRSGRFVTCAATGQRIPLDTLRYWSSERQEPYAGAAEAARVLGGRAA